ncbi:hypothetical protein [Nocardioides pakistanensis]
MSRASVDRLLSTRMSLPKSKLSRGKVYDRYSTGWRLSWSKWGHPQVTYEPGNISVAYHPDADGSKRRACLDEVAQVLSGAGFLIDRTADEVRILRHLLAEDDQ